MTPAISIENLTFSYRGREEPALRNIMGQLEEGTFVVVMGSRWVVNMTEPYVDFGTFLGSIAVAMVCGYVATTFVDWYRKELIMELKVEGKEAVSEHGTYIGKIVGIDAKKDKLIIQTIFDKRYALPISAVSTVDEHVVLKAEE